LDSFFGGITDLANFEIFFRKLQSSSLLVDFEDFFELLTGKLQRRTGLEDQMKTDSYKEYFVYDNQRPNIYLFSLN
jgi:hypothetical protein